ncbi:MAG: chorismate synthase [Phycisphaerae bacterium]
MIGCNFGRIFQVSVAGGSYQEGLTTVIQGHPPAMEITEQEIYGDLLLRKPGADELSSPRKEPDLPVIYTGLNADDTIEGAGNKNHTNGTPLTILIPNLDRHFIHVKQYQDTNRTPRPGHASYASFVKYGPDDDAIGAGFFSGRRTSTIVAAGYVAKKILKKFGIEVFSYITEIAGASCGEIDHQKALQYTEQYKKMRCDYDPFYQEVYVKGRINMNMRFLEKMSIFAQIENEIDAIRDKTPKMIPQEIREKYGVHHIVNCPDIDAAQAMVDAANKVSQTGDSCGGVVEVVVLGLPVGLGEPAFCRLDSELGKLIGIGAVKAVEIGAGMKVKDMTGIQSNDAIHSENGQVVFDSNQAGGITGGLSTGQPVVVRVAVKPTPTIDKPQHTIDKYTLENTQLAAITRRDPTITGRIWPVAENYTAMVILDSLMAHLAYQAVKNK